MSRYKNLQSNIVQECYTCHLNCIEIGSRGLVMDDNMSRLSELFKFMSGKSRTNKQFSKELSKIALICSYSIWNARNEPIWDSAPCMEIEPCCCCCFHQDTSVVILSLLICLLFSCILFVLPACLLFSIQKSVACPGIIVLSLLFTCVFFL